MKIKLNFYNEYDELIIELYGEKTYKILTKKIIENIKSIYTEEALIVIYKGKIFDDKTDFYNFDNDISCAVFIDTKINNSKKKCASKNMINNIIVDRQLMLVNNLMTSLINSNVEPYDSNTSNYTSVSGDIVNSGYTDISFIENSNINEEDNDDQNAVLEYEEDNDDQDAVVEYESDDDDTIRDSLVNNSQITISGDIHQTNESYRVEYFSEISLLNNMGYFDDNLNILALESVSGSVNGAIDFIESLR